MAEFGLGCLEESLGVVTANPRVKGILLAVARQQWLQVVALGVDTTGELREAASYCGILLLNLPTALFPGEA